MKFSNDNVPDKSDDPLESLFRDISARPKPPAEIEQAVYAHVSEHWKNLRASKARKKKAVYWSVAASALMALLIGPLIFQSRGMVGDVEALGIVQNQKGSISVYQDNKRTMLKSGEKSRLLFPGQTFITEANSGALIKWGEESTVRVDQHTELYLRSPTEIELVTGQVYVDIKPKSAHNPSDVNFRIFTHLGTIDHIGTQFMVSSDAANVDVKVREGAVSISNNNQVFVTAKGQQSILGQSDQVSHQAILTYGPDWQWVEKLAPSFELEGRPVGEFLAWVSRETGKGVVFDTKAAEDIANTTIMHGSVDKEPLLALAVVLQTNELSWYEKDGTITLFVSQ